MSSFVYFKFKSQKDPTRVTIDGPHTDVWNLKREIINISRLGDGTDFDLKIYKENSDEEYTDDTEIIPKDSTVLARRLPASAPGKGRAARYVSGKPPASAKPASAATKANAAAIMDSNMTEEEKIQAMLKMTDAKWQVDKEEMSHDTRINFGGPKTKKANVPEGEPPHGYICYRCMTRGHWIQACPTNDDATYDGKPRVKKTTGIPRSMLQKVDQSEIENLDESQRQNVMVTAEGEYVLAQADKKTWQKFQDQKNANDQAKKKVQTGDKEIQELGLECPIDKRLFVDPVKTPCCGKTYCHECIENALLDNDLECPGCHTANVSLEALKPDEEIKNKIQEYQNKKPGDSPAASNGDTPKAEQSEKGSRPSSRDGSKSPKSTGSVAGRKRSASEAISSNLAVPAPAMKRQKSGDSNPATPQSQTQAEARASIASPANGSNAANEMQALMQSMQQMPNMPNMPNMSNMPMAFPGMMPFMPNMMNPMMMGMPNMNMNGMPNMSGMGGMPFVAMPNMSNMNAMNNMPNMNGMNGMNGNMSNNFNGNSNGNWNNNNNNNNNNSNNNPNPQNQHNQYSQHNQGRGGFRNNKKFNNFNKNNSPAPQQQPEGLANVPKGPKAMTAGPPVGVPTGPAAGNKFSNQQRHQGKEEDNAYMRQPVNPQRAMNRDRGRRGMRNAEYKEL